MGRAWAVAAADLRVGYLSGVSAGSQSEDRGCVGNNRLSSTWSVPTTSPWPAHATKVPSGWPPQEACVCS